TQLGAALAELGEVERGGTVAHASDGQGNCAAAGVAAHEHVVDGRHRWAIEQVIDGVDVALTGSAGPEVEAGRFVCSGGSLGHRFLGEGSLRPIHGELDDTRNHYCRSLRGLAAYALFDAIIFFSQPMPHCLTMPPVSSRIVTPCQ